MHLGQSQLADRFEASRVPVREALKLLVAEGLINHDPNRGFFVAEVSSAEARQLYRMRHLLESELLSTVDWPSEAKLAELTERVAELQELLETGDRPKWAIRHRDFHNAVFDLSPDKTIVAEVQRLWTLSDRYRSLLPAARLAQPRAVDRREPPDQGAQAQEPGGPAAGVLRRADAGGKDAAGHPSPSRSLSPAQATPIRAIAAWAPSP